MVIGVRRFEQDDGACDAYAWHQDQVVVVPPGARVVGHAAHCPVGALDYDFAGYSVQYHPEYQADTISREIEHAMRRYLDHDLAEQAFASIRERPVDPSLAVERCADTLRRFRVTA
jgi:GMP synthase (glutamine-hydrolysing)